MTNDKSYYDKTIDDVASKYNISSKNKYGQLFVTLNVSSTPISKAKYPHSHYNATARVNSIVNNSHAGCPNA